MATTQINHVDYAQKGRRRWSSSCADWIWDFI